MRKNIILAHGVCRFDALWRQDNSTNTIIDSIHYFNGIRKALSDKHNVHHTNVSWATNVKVRATELLDQVRDYADKQKSKVHIIAHSMGGLDARHMCFMDRDSPNPIHKSIASLTTISTPHAGTPFADYCVKFGGVPLRVLLRWLKPLGLDLDGLRNLTIQACKKFNEDEDVIAFEKELFREVVCKTYAGEQGFFATFSPLKPSHLIISLHEGANDGLVSVRSAKWHESLFAGTIKNADHLNELAWCDPAQFFAFEDPIKLKARIHKFYKKIADDLP